MSLAPDVNMKNIGETTEGFTGAQIQAVCREAGMFAVRRSAFTITEKDLVDAIAKVGGEKQNQEERMYR
jgi:proteasome regulatory subunit